MIEEGTLEYLESKGPKDEDTSRALSGATFEGEGPNEYIYSFAGNLEFQDGKKFPLNNNGILLKGCTLRDTEWVVGVAVYTGHDTKIMKNSSIAKVKRSKNAKALNYYILICMLVQFLCSVLGALISTIESKGSMKDHWYLQGDEGSSESAGVMFLKETAIWFITLMNFVPISLLVTLEMINFAQAQFIMWDIDVYDDT